MFFSFICFQSSYWPLGYVLKAGGLEGYIYSGNTYYALLLLETWQSSGGGFQLGPPGVPCLHPTPLLVEVTNTVQHWFMPRRPPTSAVAWKEITIWRSRLNNASFQTPLCMIQSWKNGFEPSVAHWKLDHSYVMVAPISIYKLDFLRQTWDTGEKRK